MQPPSDQPEPTESVARPDSGFASAAGGRLAPISDDDASVAGVDAFAPLTEEELAAEQRVESALRRADRGRLVAALLAVAVLAALVVGGRFLFATLGADDEDDGALVFEEVPDGTDGGDGAGPPVAEPALVTPLATVLALRAGEGPAESRLDAAVDPTILPVAPGSVVATLFVHEGVGQVLLTGPEGWYAAGCVRASVVAATMRPFDSVWYAGAPGACDTVGIGRQVEPSCAGPGALMLPLGIPAGAVELEEGGEAGADAVRASIAVPAPGYEEVSVRGTVSVPSASVDVRIPAFGAAPGDALEIPLGDAGGGLVATCTFS